MEGRRLIFNDGSVIENAEAGCADGSLWLYIPNCTMQAAAAIGLDTDKNYRIRFQYGDMEDVYTGFTACATLSVSGDGLASICLKKPGT